MKENLFVSSKGQITLPAAMRQALGLHGNAIVTAEERDGRIVLSPAMVVETEIWPDADIATWDAADSFAPGERETLQAKLDAG
jgi:antitoxin PrlF